MIDKESSFSFAELISVASELQKIIKSKLRKIVLIIIFGSLVGLGYSYIIKPSYKALLTFALDEDKGTGGGSISNALGIASQFGIDLGNSSAGGAFAATNLIELMKSRLIVEKTLLRPIDSNSSLTLVDYYLSKKELGLDLDDYGGIDKIQFNKNRNSFTIKEDSILYIVYKQLLKKNINISQKDKKVTIISIEVNSKNEYFSKKLCEALAKELSEFYIDSKTRKARINVNILQKQADSIRNELNIAMYGAAVKRDIVFNLNPSLNKFEVSSRKNMVDVQADTKILEQIVIQLELAKVTLRKETPLIQIIDSPILPLEVEKVGKIKSALLFGLLSAFLALLYFIVINYFSTNRKLTL